MLATATHRNAKAIAAGAISLHLGDGTTLPLPDNTLDAVLSVHNFYFWPQPRVTLADIARTLRTGGRLVVTSLAADYPLPARFDPAIYPRARHRRRHGMATRGGLRRCRRTTQATHRFHRVAHRYRGMTRKWAADLQPRLRANPWRPCPSG
jgi:ubiquinone/menaquinone biosynthesis C-methylase UbiE